MTGSAVVEVAPGPVAGPREDAARRWQRKVDNAHQLAGRLAAVQADLVAFTEELIASEAWRGDGIHSVEHWLQVFLGVSPSNATSLAAVATRASELPEVISSLNAGRLGLDQAAVVAQHVPANYSASVTEFAENATVTQLRRTLRRYHYPQAAHPSPHEQPNPAEAHERTQAETPHLAMHTTGSRFELRFTAPAVDGALIETAIREAKDALFTAGQTNATLADGLIETANRSLHAITGQSRKEHYRILLHLETTGHGWLTKKGAIPEHLMREYTCDGTLQPVWETNALPVSVGRAQRIVPLRTRRLIEDRDRGCRYPGCSTTGFLENHHIQHWSHGGPTDQDTLVSLCPTHHRLHHQGHYTITGNPNIPHGLTFTNSYGCPIGANPEHTAQAAAAVTTDPRSHPNPYRGPTGGRLDTTAIHFTPNPPQRE